MCGLAGYYGHLGEASHGSALLTAMTDAIAYRGPDDSGHWQGHGIGLGHRRLSIVGLADGQQPMHSADDRLVISYNGEVFNHIELRRDLEQRGHVFRSHSDTEVILALYAQYGTNCVDHINGDFAFALWDKPAQRLLLARDRIGVRPLFYTKAKGILFFASEIKALLATGQVQAELDPFALDDTFTHWAPLPPKTMFRNIVELPPGHRLVIDAGHQRLERYWQLDFPDADHSRAEPDIGHTTDEILDLLDDAVRIRLRADVPVGSYLSGGLDSSLTTALACRHVTQQLHTFSVAFTTPEFSEAKWQEQVATALGTRHSVVDCSPGDIGAMFPEVIAHTETPILRTAPAPLFALSRLVSNNGLKVVLTGEGADEVFGGYDIFKEAKVRRFAARQPSSRFRPLLFNRLYPYMAALQSQSPEYLAAFFGADPESLADPLHSHRPRIKGTSAAKLVYSAELKTTLAGYDSVDALIAQLPQRFGRWHPLHQAQYLETTFLLPRYILSSQGDRVAMAHGVEARFPFLDHRVVERAAALPPEFKLRGMTEKFILRQVAARLLPPSVAARPKQPYRAPDSASFVGPHQPAYLDTVLSTNAVEHAGLFNPKVVTGLLGKAQRSGLDSFRDNTAFVGVVSSQIWHRQFIENAQYRALGAA